MGGGGELTCPDSSLLFSSAPPSAGEEEGGGLRPAVLNPLSPDGYPDTEDGMDPLWTGRARPLKRGTPELLPRPSLGSRPTRESTGQGGMHGTEGRQGS